MSPELIALVESYEYFPNKSGNLDEFALAAFNLGRSWAMNDTVKATSLEAVIAAIRVERAYQDRIWGGKEHDIPTAIPDAPLISS